MVFQFQQLTLTVIKHMLHLSIVKALVLMPDVIKQGNLNTTLKRDNLNQSPLALIKS